MILLTQQWLKYTLQILIKLFLQKIPKIYILTPELTYKPIETGGYYYQVSIMHYKYIYVYIYTLVAKGSKVDDLSEVTVDHLQADLLISYRISNINKSYKEISLLL